MRPLNQSEFNHDAIPSDLVKTRRESAIPAIPKKTVSVLDEQVLIFDPSDGTNGFVKGIPTHTNKRTRDLQYAFDRVFPESAGQRDVYVDAVQNLLDGVMDGINATVFAYGATGAGKTYTISGTKEDPGIMPLCMLELFDKIKNSEKQNLVDVTVSYLEVYNETIRDLLCPDTGILDLREDSNSQVVVAGLSEHQPKSYDEIMELLDIGTANRTQNSTRANEASSRSHGIFQINIQQRDRNTGVSARIKTATLTLCDLAGSERASVTDNRGQLLREGANINKSLLALGNCINALCDSKKSLQHIPFRDSKLTRLLKYSLGGNCRTVMIANVSPALCHYEETHNTLKYAWRAKKIKMNIQKNSIDFQYHVGQYGELVLSLQSEVNSLRAQLTAKSNGPTYTFNPQLPGNLSVFNLINYLSFVNEQFSGLAHKENEADWSETFSSTIRFLEKQKSITEQQFVDQSRQFLKCLMKMDLSDAQRQQILMIQVQSIVSIFGATSIESEPNAEQVNPAFLFSPRKGKPAHANEAKENQNAIVNEIPPPLPAAGKKEKVPRRRSFLPVPVATSQTSRPNPIFGSARKPLTRRASMLQKLEQPLPPVFQRKQYTFTDNKLMISNGHEKRDIADDLLDIDSFLNENSTPQQNRIIKTDFDDIEDDEATPKATSLADRYNLRSYQSQCDELQPRKTPRQLRSFVAAQMINSPQITAMPFSPAKPSRRLR